MEYKKIKCNNYNIHAIKTKKFKTITIKINFKRELKKEEITLRNMLVNILFSSSKKYNTKRLMEIETEELYGLGYRGSNYQSGIYNIMSYDISFLNDVYTEQGITEKAIDFLHEILMNTNIVNDSFTDESFSLAYNVLHDNIISIRENTNLYSQIRMLENMDNSIISYRSCGYLSDLDKLTPSDLYKYYLNVLDNDIIDIFVIGDFDDSLINKIKNTFKFNDRNNILKNHFFKHDSYRIESKEIIEEERINQSKLVLGFKLKELTNFELRYVLNIYNYILGGNPDSKLFKNVREKESLCYTISSSSQPLNGIFMIRSGINAKDYQKALDLIKIEIDNMANGNFDDTDILNGISTYINSLEELKDNPDSIMSLYAGMEYLNSDDIENRIKNIKKVTKEDIVNLSHKINLDIIYLLKGTENE